jgi:WD40 repeat protein
MPAETPTPPKKYTVPAGGADPYATHLSRELKHDRGMLQARYDHAGSHLFAGGLDSQLHRWDLAAEKRDPFPGHESWVGAVAPFPDGKQVASGDFVGRLILWETAADGSLKARHSIAAHTGSIRAVAVSPDGKSVASAGNDGLVRVWSAADARKVHEFAGHECHVYHTAFHPGGTALVSADLKGRVRHWDLATGKLNRELDASPLHIYSEKYSVDVGGIRGMSFDASGKYLACAGATGERGIAHSGSARVLLFDWESGAVKNQFHPGHEEICTAWGVKFHPDGFVIGSGGSRTGGYLWFWLPGEDAAFHQVKFKERAPGFDVDLSPDKQTLAVANHDGAIRFWKMATETPKPAATPAKKTT